MRGPAPRASVSPLWARRPDLRSGREGAAAAESPVARESGFKGARRGPGRKGGAGPWGSRDRTHRPTGTSPPRLLGDLGFPGLANRATSVPLDSLTYQGTQAPPQPRARRARPPRRPPQDHAPPIPGQSLSGPRGGSHPFILLCPIRIHRTRKPRPCRARARARASPAVQLAAGDAQGVMRAPQGCVRSPATF